MAGCEVKVWGDWKRLTLDQALELDPSPPKAVSGMPRAGASTYIYRWDGRLFRALRTESGLLAGRLLRWQSKTAPLAAPMILPASANNMLQCHRWHTRPCFQTRCQHTTARSRSPRGTENPTTQKLQLGMWAFIS